MHVGYSDTVAPRPRPRHDMSDRAMAARSRSRSPLRFINLHTDLYDTAMIMPYNRRVTAPTRGMIVGMRTAVRCMLTMPFITLWHVRMLNIFWDAHAHLIRWMTHIHEDVLFSRALYELDEYTDISDDSEATTIVGDPWTFYIPFNDHESELDSDYDEGIIIGHGHYILTLRRHYKMK